MNIIHRSAWGARYPDGGGPAPLPAREVYLHHSVTIAPDLLPPFDDDDAAVRTLETIGQQRFKQGISYTFPITPVGRVYQGHSVNRLGAHTGGRNSIARAICFVGNYDVAKPTPQMIEAAAQLLVHGYRSGWWTAPRITGGHQQAPGASTACPGRHAMAAIPVINARAAAILVGAPAPQEDDMPGYRDWDPADKAALMDDISRHVWNRSAEGSNAPWPIHMLVGVDSKTGATSAGVAQLLARGGSDAKAVADALRPVLTDVVREAQAAERDEANSETADQIVDRIADRLAGSPAS